MSAEGDENTGEAADEDDAAVDAREDVDPNLLNEEELRREVELLREERQDRDRQILELQEETESRIRDVVQKAKDHVKQVQGRLEALRAEKEELNGNYQEVDGAYKEQQEKLQKYKQLMSQANARIETSEETVRELRDALAKSQAQRMNLEQQLSTLAAERQLNIIPPAKEEIARMGGIILAVEGSGDDVWCLLGSSEADADGEDEQPTGASRCQWWLLSQLDVEEKPIPVQRRWRGEVSALRAQMSRAKKRSEEVQEEFDTYKQKAGAALQHSAALSEEASARERKLEEIGAQLQSTAAELQLAKADKGRAWEDLAETKKKLHEVTQQRSELESLLERRAQEWSQRQEDAMAECQRGWDSQRQSMEQAWREKERIHHQELHMRRVEKEALQEELERMRAKLSKLSALLAAAEDPTASGKPVASDSNSLPTPSAQAAVAAALSAAISGTSPTSGKVQALSGSVPDLQDAATQAGLSSARGQPSEGSETPAAASSSKDLPSSRQSEPPGNGAVATDESEAEPPRARSKPSTAFSLQGSLAQQDLAGLRAQVRSLEGALEEERLHHAASRKEREVAARELSDFKSQQQLQKKTGEQQQMEYIRNVFKKFVESMPQGSLENEQLIPVLMAFFQFPDDQAKSIQARRAKQKPSGGFLAGFGGWGQR